MNISEPAPFLWSEGEGQLNAIIRTKRNQPFPPGHERMKKQEGVITQVEIH